MKVTLSGKVYALDGIKVSEGRVIKREFGWTIKAWERNLDDLDPDALASLVWVLRTRDGESLTIAEVDFDLADISVDNEVPTEADEAPTLTSDDATS